MPSPVTSFLSQDYESIFADVKNFAETTFPSEFWTDFNPTQVGTYLLRVQAYIGDLLGFQVNASVAESFLVRCVRERNMRMHAQAASYVMKSATGATTTLRVYDLPAPPNVVYPFTISKHHQFSVDGVVFQPLVDKTVTDISVLNNVDDGYYTDIDVKQGAEVFEEVTGTSNNRPSQQFVLRQNPVQDGTLEVSVPADGGYTLVAHFTDSTTTSQHFRVYVNDFGQTTIEFGDGVTGKIPTAGQQIIVTYRIGGGIDGNMPTEMLEWTASGSTSGASPLPSVLQAASIRNITASVGGGAKETLEHARRAIPAWLRTNDRAIAVGDYGDLSQQVAGVSHAKSIAGRPVLGARPVYTFIVPLGGGAPSAPLLDDVAAYLAPRKEVGRIVYLQGARYVNVKLSVEAFLSANARRTTVAGYLNTALTLAFDTDALDFSATFPIQYIYDTVDPQKIPGLRYASIREFRLESGWDTYPSNPPVGNGVVYYLSTGVDNAVTREWNVRFINPTPPLTCPEFQVYERVNATATTMSSSTVTDSGSYFPAGSFVGHTLVPRPEDGMPSTFLVTANTDRQLEVAPAGVNTHMSVGDAFALERLISNGKVLKSVITAATVAGVTITTPTTNWVVNDEVLVIAAGSADTRARITAIGVGTLTLSVAVTVDNLDTVQYVWKDSSARMEFSLDAGTSPFSVGDQLYVDTYAKSGDLILRGSEFPILDSGDLTVTIIGGVSLCSSAISRHALAAKGRPSTSRGRCLRWRRPFGCIAEPTTGTSI